jgi:hypothetical protein
MGRSLEITTITKGLISIMSVICNKYFLKVYP